MDLRKKKVIFIKLNDVMKSQDVLSFSLNKEILDIIVAIDAMYLVMITENATQIERKAAEYLSFLYSGVASYCLSEKDIQSFSKQLPHSLLKKDVWLGVGFKLPNVDYAEINEIVCRS